MATNRVLSLLVGVYMSAAVNVRLTDNDAGASVVERTREDANR